MPALGEGDTGIVLPQRAVIPPQMIVAQFLQDGTFDNTTVGDAIAFVTGAPVAYTTPPDGSPIADYFTIGSGADHRVINLNPSSAKPGFYSAHFSAQVGGVGAVDLEFTGDLVSLISAGIDSINAKGSVRGKGSVMVPPWPYNVPCTCLVEVALAAAGTVANGILTLCYYGQWDGHGVGAPE